MKRTAFVLLFCIIYSLTLVTMAKSETDHAQKALESCLDFFFKEAVIIKNEKQFLQILEYYKTNGISLNNPEGRYSSLFFEYEPRYYDILKEEKGGYFYVTVTLYHTQKTHMGDYGELGRYKFRIKQINGVNLYDKISFVTYLEGPSYMWQCMTGSENCYNDADEKFLSEFKKGLYDIIYSFK